MATTYPGSQQTFTNPTASDPLNSPSHSGNHTLIEDTVEALQATIGYTGSFNFATNELDNLGTVACNTSLVSDTDSTDNLGSILKYWANTYTDALYLNSTAYFSGSGAGVAALTGKLTVDHIGETTGAHGVQFDSLVGINIAADDNIPLNVSGGNDNQAAFIAFTATNAGTGGIALGGYTSTTGAKGSTRNVYGLQYGNWWGFNVGAVGDAYLNHYGADVAGSISYASGAGGFTTLNSIGIRANGYSNSMGGSYCEYATSTNAIGGKFSAIDGNGGANNITITNAYGVYIYSVLNDADHLITNDYQEYIEAPANTASTNRYQLVLAGTGTGTGLWLGGTSSNSRLYMSAASVLDLDIGGTTILQISANGFGYSAGGSTVTQITSKSTTVTINAVCGTITTHNAALAAATIVSFQVTNSKVAATDVIHVQHDSGGTLGSYTINPSGSAAGHFHIDIRNNTAGSLSEALVIRFAVIKAVAA